MSDYLGTIAFSKDSKIAFYYKQTARLMAVLRNTCIENTPKKLPYSEISVLSGNRFVKRFSFKTRMGSCIEICIVVGSF